MSFVIVGAGILAAPALWEGPVLLPISPGHAFSVLDTIALAPLLLGTGWLYYGLWLHRRRLYEVVRAFPQVGSLSVFIAGTGMSLLIASSFSAFFWWWAIGVFLFSVMLLVALKHTD